MIVPTKFRRYSDTTLSKIAPALLALQEPAELIELYHSLGKRYGGLDEFLLALDVLYILGAIDVDLHSGIVRRAE